MYQFLQQEVYSYIYVYYYYYIIYIFIYQYYYQGYYYHCNIQVLLRPRVLFWYGMTMIEKLDDSWQHMWQAGKGETKHVVRSGDILTV